MPQHQNCPHKAGRPGGQRAKLFRVIAGASLLALLLTLNAPPVRAADDTGTASSSPSGWTKFMQFMGLKPSDGPGINYTERAPLVVPPSRDLPPPADSAALPAADWPKDSTQHHKTAKEKAVIPGTALQMPNPPYQKKPWYNPAGWFDKTEYANFAGEPVRQNLTDPPLGYRMPSPTQLYGIPPDKQVKTGATAQDLHLGSVTPPAGK